VQKREPERKRELLNHHAYKERTGGNTLVQEFPDYLIATKEPCQKRGKGTEDNKKGKKNLVTRTTPSA